MSTVDRTPAANPPQEVTPEPEPAPEPKPAKLSPAKLPPAKLPPAKLPKEIGGPKGPEPTRYGDWQFKGRVTDF